MPSKRKRVQLLLDLFWKQWQWRKKPVNHPQQSTKMNSKAEINISIGDVVLSKDSSVHRYDWKMAVLEHVFPSVSDQKVQKSTPSCEQ